LQRQRLFLPARPTRRKVFLRLRHSRRRLSGCGISKKGPEWYQDQSLTSEPLIGRAPPLPHSPCSNVYTLLTYLHNEAMNTLDSSRLLARACNIPESAVDHHQIPPPPKCNNNDDGLLHSAAQSVRRSSAPTFTLCQPTYHTP
jgi:hypothetical protein